MVLLLNFLHSAHVRWSLCCAVFIWCSLLIVFNSLIYQVFAWNSVHMQTIFKFTICRNSEHGIFSRIKTTVRHRIKEKEKSDAKAQEVNACTTGCYWIVPIPLFILPLDRPMQNSSNERTKNTDYCDFNLIFRFSEHVLSYLFV